MKKVLIITYYWPPAGGSGVQRWLKFVKYLPEFNIEPIVYCPKNPYYPTIDISLWNDVNKKLKVLKHPIKEPIKILNKFFRSKLNNYSKGIIPKVSKQNFLDRLLIFIRGNFFIPDSRVFWVKPSVKFLSSYISKNHIDTIITTGPPHSVHMIGLQLKNKFNLKWYSDFRDPWTAIGYHSSLKLISFNKKKHFKLEKEILSNSDHIIVTSDRTKELFTGYTTNPISVITNGFDKEIKNNLVLDANFTLTHVGFLSNQRNPQILWDVLSELVKKVNGFKEKFKLVLVGDVSPEILSSINFAGLNLYLKLIPTVPHIEAVNYQNRSQALLLIEANTISASYIIPGKLFEYLGSGRPIIGIGPELSDINSILNKTSTGVYFNYSEHKKLKSHILDLFLSYNKNNLKITAKNIQKYSRYNCTKKLSEILSQ